MSKIRELEQEVHLRVKQFQRKVAALLVASMIALVGVGLWILAAYNGFKEVTSPALAAFYTGLILFALCGALFYFGTRSPVKKKMPLREEAIPQT